jgi:hypothetical protein
MKRALLGVLVLMNTAGAFAKGNEDSFKGGEICSVESEDIILKRKLQYNKCPTEFAFINCFEGVYELIVGVVPMGKFYGSGSKVYTGKHSSYKFTGYDSLGNKFELESPYGADFAPYTLKSEVNGGVDLTFEVLELVCRPIIH